jgi:hypothetical protein
MSRREKVGEVGEDHDDRSLYMRTGICTVVVLLLAGLPIIPGGAPAAFAVPWVDSLGGDGDDAAVATTTGTDGSVYVLWTDADCGEGEVEDAADLVVSQYTRAVQGGWEGVELWRWNSEAETDSVIPVT